MIKNNKFKFYRISFISRNEFVLFCLAIGFQMQVVLMGVELQKKDLLIFLFFLGLALIGVVQFIIQFRNRILLSDADAIEKRNRILSIYIVQILFPITIYLLALQNVFSDAILLYVTAAIFVFLVSKTRYF
ncbi:MAG: hypothetical protein ACRCUP_01950 [Mycoplasmatales bacterium]